MTVLNKPNKIAAVPASRSLISNNGKWGKLVPSSEFRVPRGEEGGGMGRWGDGGKEC
uniref:Uncharacterized protein n=1 Tax=Desertifilum tharense IPPAS B-1220 TaxID=1781255 RepID=A0ACD5H2M5_9CYAN